MTDESQLGWEARLARPVAIAAFVSALLSIAGQIAVGQLQSDADDTVEFILLADEQPGDFVVAVLIVAVSTFLLTPVLWYLYRAAKHRRPEVPRIALYLAIAGPIASGVLQIVHQVQLLGIASDLVDKLPLAVGDAEDLIEDRQSSGGVAVVGGLAFAAGLALAFALILVSLHAMRAGLTSRFIGILGIIIGVLYVLPILFSQSAVSQPSLIQFFWLIAMGLLFLGRWPGGRGPAWESGEAEPWPSQLDRREEVAGVDRAPSAEPEAEEPEAEEEAEEPAARPAPVAPRHPRSKKRGRKRRR